MLAAAALLMSAQAGAFDIQARSDNLLLTDTAMKARALEIAAEIGTRIPDDPRIRVSVYSRALESKIEGSLIYFHRVQLTKAFTSSPPYPFAGYLPLRSVERYGVDVEDGMREKFDEALRVFFKQMLTLDPNGEPE
ncbi:MAG: hypothetical protein C0434_00780 [Xanthomonadaceae bacterium]|nr:hypothetical protein [Xanthomonadaceae bacterium]